MTQLERLQLLTEERDSPDGCTAPRMFTDADLIQLLELHGCDLYQTAYDVLLHKAERTDVSLPEGISLPDQSAHFLRLAAHVRRNHTRNAPRADDPRPEPPREETP